VTSSPAPRAQRTKRAAPTSPIRQTIRADSSATSAARRFVRTKVTGIDGIRRLEAKLLVTEVVAIFLGTSPTGTLDRIVIEASRQPGIVRLSLSAPGSGLDWSQHVLSRRLLEKMSSGWGSGVENGTLTIWFELRRPGGAIELEGLDDIETLQRAKTDEVARSLVVKRYQPLVQNLVSDFRGKMVESEDLEQVAAMALIGAIDRFDPTAGSFPAFASVTISGELKRHLRDRGWSVRVPRSLQDSALIVGRAKRDLTQTLQRAPSAEEIAHVTGLSPAEVVSAEEAGAAYRADSLNAPVSESDPDQEVIDRLGGHDSNMQRVELWQDLGFAIRELPDRDRKILFLRFFEDHTQSEIAEVMGISQMHVSRILSRSIESVRKVLVAAEEQSDPRAVS
jgi:RNA polymerase sigma-B factor